MKTVTINGKVHNVSGNILVYVNRLELSRKAIITWVDKDTCIIVDNGAMISRPITSLSSGYTTTIKDWIQ